MADGSGSTLGGLLIGAAALAAVGAGTLWFGGGADAPSPGGVVPPSTSPATATAAAQPVPAPAGSTAAPLRSTGFTPPGFTPGPVRPTTAPKPPGLVTTGTPKPVVIPRPVPGQEPVIVFETKLHDFGTVLQGRNPVTTFRFRNTGQGPLHIVRIHSHCACAPAMPGARVIPAGGVGEIRVTFQTASLTGRVSKTVDVTTNDPATPKVTLVVAAEIVREYRFSPDAFAFGRLAPGSAATRTVEVRHGQGAPFRIVEVWGAPATCAVRAEPVPGDAGRWRVIFDVPKQTSAMTAAGRVLLRTEPATPTPLWIAYSFSVQPSIELDPWRVNWGNQRPAARPSADVRIRALGGAPFTVLGTTVTPRDQLVVTTHADPGGDGWIIRITPGKAWPKSGRVQASVRVRTDHLKVPAVIPVYAVVVPDD